MVCVVLSMYFLRLLFVSHHELIEAGNQRYESFILADELRQSSDDLTRLARLYAATGDEKFERQFKDVLAIRNGQKPRPIHYERIYWEFFAVGDSGPVSVDGEPYGIGEAVPLEALMKRAGFTEAELGLLHESLKRSDTLVGLEETAMNAVKGLFPDEQGQFTVYGKPDREKALNILFGEAYLNAKKNILEPINVFFESLDNRTQNHFERVSIRNRTIIVFLSGLFVSTIVLTSVLLMTLRLYHKSMVLSLHEAIDDKTIELMDANLNLKIAKEAAESANEAKSGFLTSMSHELRTPLNAIIGFSNILAQSESVSPSDRKHLETINRNGEHLLGLINEVLDMAKIEAGRVTLNITSFSFRELLSDIENMMRVKVKEKSLDMVVECGPEVPDRIRADELKLRQVLINLMSNAVKFTAKGSIRLAVSSEDIPETDDGACLSFEVKDTGAGISLGEMDRLFQPFFQTKTGLDSREGTGLGLSISRGFVRMMGGDISVESREGEGSIFSFTVNVISDEMDGAVIPKEGHSPTMKNLPGRSVIRALVADDDADNRRLLDILLTSYGMDVQQATDGLDAYHVYRSWGPDVVVADLALSRMVGLDLARKIREHDDFNRAVLIATSSRVFENEEEQVLDAGFDALLSKPFKETEIFTLIERHLRLRSKAPSEDGEAASAGFRFEDLLHLPRTLLDDMEQACIQGNADKMREIIRTVRQDSVKLADALSSMVDDFEFHEILSCIKDLTHGD